MFGSASKEGDGNRRLLHVRVIEADLPGPPREVFISGSLFRVHDDKEIDKEKETSPAFNTKGGAESKLPIGWECEFGKAFNLNHETGNPILKLVLFSKKKSSTGFSTTKVPFGVVEIELDEVPSGPGADEWKDLERDGPATAGVEPGRLRMQVGFTRDVEDASAASSAVLLNVDPELEESDEDIYVKFQEYLAGSGKKKKKKVPAQLPKSDCVGLAANLLQSRFPPKVIEKRYAAFGGGKHMSQEDFLEFYKSIKPMAPNELQVVVVRAEKLRAADGTTFGGAGSSDPFVMLRVGSKTKKTTHVKKDLNPFFNQKFSICAVDSLVPLEVLVYDYDAFHSGTFLGRCTIPLKSLIGKEPELRWFALNDEKGNKDHTTRGSVQLILRWRHNPDPAFKPKKWELKPKEEEGSEEEEDEEEVDMDPASNPDTKAGDGAKDEEAKKAKEEAAKETASKLSKEQENFKVISGDYQIHVHIIECRDLRPKNMNGTSDPVVSVEAFGQKQNTSVVESTLSPVFDDLLIFNLKGLDKDEFEEGTVKVTVKDSGMLSDVMIGSYGFDATYVYYQKDHELYNAWVALMNEKDPADEGVQGYLKISVQIVGPNDKLKIHHEEETKAKTSDDDIGSMVLMPPTIKKQQKWLVVTAHCAEYLVMLDEAIGAAGIDLSSSGVDAFYRVDFSDSKVSSNVVTVKGKSRHMLNPEWHFELWIPILVPTATDKVKHSVWDYDLVGDNDIAGVFYSSFKAVNSAGKLPPAWHNLYGAPTQKDNNMTLRLGGVNWRDKYNETPNLGSTYRGRVLVSQRVRDSLPAKEIEGDRKVAPWKRKVKVLDPLKYPKTETYVLKAGIVSGSELPKLSSTTLGGGNRKMGVMITCGKYVIVTKRAANNNGCADWGISDEVSMELPRFEKYPDQFPDIFVYLFTGKNAIEMVPMCFTRIKAATLFEDGFEGDFKWYTLQEDKALDKLPDKMFPGCLLLRLGLGTATQAAETAEAWDKMVGSEVLSQKVPYIVRVNVMMCRSLPAADDDGMIDPYLRVNMSGCPEQTSFKRQNTRDPMYFQTFDFKTEINHLFGLQLAPRVCIQLWDTDFGFGDTSDDYCGCCMLDLKDSFVDASEDMDRYVLDSTVEASLPKDLPKTVQIFKPKKGRLAGHEFPDPKWVDFMYEKEGDAEGHLLASVQLIPSSPGHALDMSPPNILPDSREAWLEITTLGCRNLIPYNFLPITLPRLEFVLETAEETIQQSTPDSKKPTPQNPNYLRYDVLKVAKFPKKAIYAPRLLIKAFDTRLGGLSKPNIGNCTVALEKKLPWDPDFVAFESSFGVPPPPDLTVKKAEGEDGEDDDDDGDLDGFNDEEGAVGGEDDGDLNLNADTVVLEDPVGTFKERLAEIAGDEDSGAGVFGALKHLEKERAAEDALLEAAFDLFDEAVEEEDEPDKPPAYMLGRQVLEGPLEEVLETTPFENFDLLLGSGDELRTVGVFKGLIRIMDHEPTEEESPFDLQMLLKSQVYKVRLYVLKGMKFTPMDPGWNGRPGKSDPYLKVELGKELYNGRDNYFEDAVDCDFYTCIELNAELPGAGQLVISVMDADTFGSDDVIGRTVVDLEDRWFDERWQALGAGTESKEEENMRCKAKPLEFRTIHLPPVTKNAMAHGYLETWVDVLLPAEATAYLPDDVSLPPIATFEVRVVVWKAKDVSTMDSIDDMSDTYVKASIEGVEAAQTTDTHWRAKKGKASWNWRMKFDAELGHNTRTMKFPYLKLQMWDKDILKYDDLIAETDLDIGQYLKRAYKKNKVVKLFDDALKKRKKKAKAPKPPEDTTGLSKEYEFEETPPAVAEPATPDPAAANPTPATTAATPPPDAAAPDSTPSAEAGQAAQGDGATTATALDGSEGAAGTGSNAPAKEIELTTANPIHGDSGPSSAGGSGDAPAEPPKEEKKAAKKSSWGWWGTKKKEAPEDSDDEEAPLMSKEDKEKAENDKEAAGVVSSIRGLLGLGEDDPPDSNWLQMTTKDFKTDTRIPMGKLCISIQILPKAEALINQNGFGRLDPNHTPTLPPPTGRLTFSFNPFVMGSQLCGPKLCFYFTCCLSVTAIILISVFCQPVMNLIIQLSIKLFV